MNLKLDIVPLCQLEYPLSSVYKPYCTYLDTPTVERITFSTYCDHIWSWSLNPKPIVNSPPNLFNIMRLSSISLIATALAAIAGSVIAAPRPLHVRALEDINSLSERNVDVYSRESRLALLERRDPSSKPQEAADAAQKISNKATEASFKARLIAEHGGDHTSEYYHTQERQHLTDAIHYDAMASNFRSQIGKENIRSDEESSTISVMLRLLDEIVKIELSNHQRGPSAALLKAIPLIHQNLTGELGPAILADRISLLLDSYSGD